ncbi:MAG: hypothetical protein QW304_08610 [Thermoproteota archaeon]
MNKGQFSSIKKELVAIKKLLILCAHKSGANSEEIAKVLGVGGSAIRNILAQKKRGQKK